MTGRKVFIHGLLLGLVLMMAIGSFLPPACAADYNRDGRADLAIGVKWEAVGDQVRTGAVSVLYGTDSGLSAASSQHWIQDDLIAYESEAVDSFGEAVAAGDFDGDGAVDLAVSAPYEDVGAALDCGAVQILYGSSPNGLVATGNQLWHQDSPGVGGVSENLDLFGSSLAVGDFDGDGHDDLAVGVPYEDIGEEMNAGAVNILYGSPAGLTASGSQLWYEDHNGLGGYAKGGDWFGFALAAGDFDGDGDDDLAISIPNQDLRTLKDPGNVVVLYGTPTGLTAVSYYSIVQGGFGIKDVAEANDRFGMSLATGDYDGDGYKDLAIGVPQEDVVLTVNAGMVHIVYGSPNGLTSDGNRVYTLEDRETDDEFARALVSGDFNGDGFDELAVGIPFEDLHSWANIGAVEILYGASGGLDRRTGWDDFWTQADPGMVDGPTLGDRFGTALAAGDFDGDQYADLAVGIPLEDIDTKADAGAVHILYGSADGITVTGNQFWHQDVPGIGNVAQENDRFGCSLAAIPLERFRVFLPMVSRNN